MKSKKRVTIKMIADEAGVSIATVSRALNDLPMVDNALQLRIKNIAETLGYDRFLQSRKMDITNRNMKFIVIIFGRAGSHLVHDIQTGIGERLHKSNYYELRYLIDETIELNSEAKKELFLKNVISERGVVGLLSVFVKLSDNSISNLYKNNLPVVLLNNYTDFGKCVTINNFKASYNAVKQLVKLDRKQIGCILPHEHNAPVWVERIEGYKKALKDSKIGFNPDLICYEDYFIVKDAGMATKSLIEKNPELDAILYGGDLQAYGGMKMIQELGLKIPEDIALIGFDDMVTNNIMNPSLSSIKQPMYEMGKLGIEMLLKSIQSNDFSHEEIILDTELKLRKSCLPDYKEERWNT